MKNISFIIVFTFVAVRLAAQTIYVDGVNGNDSHQGSEETPLLSIQQAVILANQFTGQGSIHIKVKPGIYLLQDKLSINPVKILNDTTRYIIEATLMPDDANWTPEKMPVIQSVSSNNSLTQFPHTTGMLVAASHVTIKGLKFLGNANPDIVYYYPISREDPDLHDLEVSQCYFIGEKHSAIIQGGIWAQGQELNINHNIFETCRNAILVFKNITGCLITNNIIYGAYESAFWVGENTSDFEFSNNVISGCDFFWTKAFGGQQTYTLKNSVIANNGHYIGRWDQEKYGLVEIKENNFKEKNITKKGEVKYVKRLEAQLPKDYLHLKPSSIGYGLKAGIFKE